MALSALVLLLSIPKLKGPIDLRYDGSVYYVLGTSIAQGHGYRLLNEPGAIEAIQYPPLLPALIAVHQRLLGTSDPFVVGTVLRLTFHALYLTLVLLAYALARRFVGTGLAFLLGVLTALNSYSYYLADLCFTEIPYSAVTMGFLLCAGARKRWSTTASGVLAMVAYLTRTSGLALLLAWVLDAVVDRRIRAALLRGVLVLIPVVAWQTYVESVKASDEYRTPAYEYQRAPWQFYNVTYADNLALVDPFRPEFGNLSWSGAAKRIVQNIGNLPLTLGEGTSLTQSAWKWPLFKVRVLVGQRIGRFLWNHLDPYFILFPLSVGLFVIVGGVSMLWGNTRLPGFYLLLSVGLICTTCWPEQNTRYLMPLAPLLILALIKGAIWVIERLRLVLPGIPITWVGKAVVAGLILIASAQAFTAYMTYTTQHSKVVEHDLSGHEYTSQYFDFDSLWRGLFDSIEWIGKHAEPDAIIASTSPHLLHLHTGHLTVMPPYEADQNRCLDLLDGIPVDYVIIDRLKFLDVGEHYVEPALQSGFERWRIVYEDSLGRVRIYGRIHSAG